MEQSGGLSWRTRLRTRLVDSPSSLGAAARQRRWDLFYDLFPDIDDPTEVDHPQIVDVGEQVVEQVPDIDDLRVVDFGGTVESWRRAPFRPREVVVVNLFEPGDSDDETLIPVTGDACAARAALTAAGIEGGFDLAFSNSLVEHVGGHAHRAELAQEIRAIAPRHWVQTPYRYFPIEPHWLFPGMQFLPMSARARVAQSWPLVHTLPETREEAMKDVQWTELIGVSEMRSYFPDSEVVHERMAGLTKSIVAVRL